MELQIEYLSIDQLIPYQNNARKHAEADIDAIASSIQEFGFDDPIGIWRDNIIVEGHGRLLAAKKLGMESVPVIRLDHLTDEQRRAYALAHNKTAELSEWDLTIQAAELENIQEIDMSAFGFDPMDEAEIEETVEDDVPEEAPPRCTEGDIWKLGDHRLMCGDSTSAEDMELLFGEEKPVFVFTDPPYGVSIGSKNKAINEVESGRGGRIQEDIEADTLPPEELYKVLVAAFTNLREHCSDDCSYYVSSPQGGELGMMMMMMKDAGLRVRHVLIWVKNTATFSLGRLDYDYRHEPIFYTWTKSHHFYGGYGNTVIDDTDDVKKMTKAQLQEALRAVRDRHDTSVIYCNKPQSSKLHPTMKPVKLVARFMHNSSKQGDLVADIFGGSGTTMITAEQMQRKCYMMEKDPHYCDVIIERWEKHTGRKAVKIE